MNQRLTQEQLNQIIAETQRIQTLREQELEPDQVKEILKELNLSPELLDEAMTQVKRRQALEVEQRRNKFILGGIAAALVLIIGSGIFISQQRGANEARITAQSDRITRTADDGSGLKVVERQSNAELFYRVTLKDAPVGQKLDLSCNWIDPSGQTVKQNSFQTKDITTSVWDTRCKYTINSGAAVGQWKVQMFLDGRLLGDESFEVR
jgi:DNA-binding transcriptional MerR regulator